MKTKEEIFEEVVNYAHIEGHYNKHEILLAMQLYADQFQAPQKRRLLSPDQWGSITTSVLTFVAGRIGKKIVKP
jgi:hypothetical protein